MATRKTPSEWDRIEVEYLAGEDSVREIADRYGITEAAIRKRAKRDGWVKPVRSANQRELRPAPPPPPRTDPEKPVDPAAIAERGRNLISRMLDELDTVTSHPAELEALVIGDCEGDDDEDRRGALLKTISLSNRAATVKTLMLALKTVNETAAPSKGVKAARQDKADAVASRFRPMGPPTLKAVP